MSRLTIVEGNTNDKDNVRAIMVKGEKGDKGDNGEISYEDVVDNLTSTETQKPLSANQGKQLKGLIDALDTQVNNSNYYDEITYTKERYYNTDCYIVNIPKYDNDSNLINVYVDSDNTKSPNEYAVANHTTLTINAGLTYQNSGGTWEQFIVIGDGELLNDKPNDIVLEDYNRYIGFKADRSIVEYQANITTAQEMLDDGVENAYLVFYKYMNNGVLEEHTDADNWTVKSPRMDIGVKTNGDIVLLACDGRTDNNEGLDNEQALGILLSKGCVNAWRTDGGGSTSLNIRESKINRNIDDNGTTDRNIHITLNVKKEIVNNELAKIYSKVSELKELLNKQLRLDLQANLDDKLDKTKINSIYASINNNSKNTLASDNVFQDAKMATRYRHGNGITSLFDNDNNTIGFVINNKTLTRLVFIGQLRSEVSGEKSLAILNADTDAEIWVQTIKVDVEGTTYKQILCDTVLNHSSDEPLNIKFAIRSNHAGDKYLRLTAFAETLGYAESDSL